MKNNFGKTLEQTIRELRQRYKNVPSPLSENYQRNRPNMVPQQTTPHTQPLRNNLLGDFTPPRKQW